MRCSILLVSEDKNWPEHAAPDWIKVSACLKAVPASPAPSVTESERGSVFIYLFIYVMLL